MSTSTETYAALEAQLEQMTAKWLRSGRLDNYLLSSEDLIEFKSYLNSGNVSPVVQEFVDASSELEKIRPKHTPWFYKVVAWIIDLMSVFMFFLLAFLIMAFIHQFLSRHFEISPSFSMSFLMTFVIVYFCYFFLGYHFGGTLGHRITGLKARSQSGAPMTWKLSVARAILNWTLMANFLTKTRISFNTSLKSAKPIPVRISSSLIVLMLIFNFIHIFFLFWYGISGYAYEYTKDDHTNSFFDGFLIGSLEGYFSVFEVTPENVTPEVAGYISSVFFITIFLWLLPFFFMSFKSLLWYRIFLCPISLWMLPNPVGFIILLFSFHPSFVRYFSFISPNMRIFLNYRRNKEKDRIQK